MSKISTVNIEDIDIENIPYEELSKLTLRVNVLLNPLDSRVYITDITCKSSLDDPNFIFFRKLDRRIIREKIDQEKIKEYAKELAAFSKKYHDDISSAGGEYHSITNDREDNWSRKRYQIIDFTVGHDHRITFFNKNGNKINSRKIDKNVNATVIMKFDEFDDICYERSLPVKVCYWDIIAIRVDEDIEDDQKDANYSDWF